MFFKKFKLSGFKAIQRVIFLLNLFSFLASDAQSIIWEDEKLNTAAKSFYMQPEEKEMIYEINRLRSDPHRYASILIKNRLIKAKEILKENGKGQRQYSLLTSYKDNKKSSIDTIWHYENEELVKALQTLYDTLLRLKPLWILLPDQGIYKACAAHSRDQAPRKEVNHQGNDGSWPWDRIIKYSPQMTSGNENIAYHSGKPSPRDIVLQLLIDAGISDYGHRYNLLDAQWTHVACYFTKKPGWAAKWWIQNFGKSK